MTNLRLKAVCLGLSFMPMLAMAQTSIRKAFDSFIDSNSDKVIPSLSLEKDPVTGVKESQCDIFRFTLQGDSGNMLKDIQNAFRKDSDAAYHTGSGIGGEKSPGVRLAVGNGSSTGVELGTEEGMNYIFASFIADEDTARNHRYAYGMEWRKDGNEIHGTLVVTYATTQSYRQQQSRGKVLRMDFGNSWFDMFNGYVTAMTKADETTLRALASKIYLHTKMKGMKADGSDKDTAREILKSMLNDERYKDDILHELLNGALQNIDRHK